MSKSPNDWEWWVFLLFAALGAFGGGMGHIMRSVDTGIKISWWRVLGEMGASAFVGLLVTLACQAMDMSLQWTGVIVGVFAWMGANASIRILERYVITKKLGVPPDDQDSN